MFSWISYMPFLKYYNTFRGKEKIEQLPCDQFLQGPATIDHKAWFWNVRALLRAQPRENSKPCQNRSLGSCSNFSFFWGNRLVCHLLITNWNFGFQVSKVIWLLKKSSICFSAVDFLVNQFTLDAVGPQLILKDITILIIQNTNQSER